MAELGRPETPEEKAARLREQSRLYRSRKTVNNLVLSLGVTLLAAFVIFLMVPHADNAPDWQVDYAQIGADAQFAAGNRLDIPKLPSTWRANQAQLADGGASGVITWRIGFITPTDALIVYRQGLDAKLDWVASILTDIKQTGTRQIAGLEWQEFDNRSSESAGNRAYSLVTSTGGSTFVLTGTASDAEFTELATAVVASLPTS